MTNKFIRNYAVVLTLGIAVGAVILYKLLPDPVKPVIEKEDPLAWYPPSIYSLVNSPESDLVLYGRELILHTAKYFGPRGNLSKISNGMNCGNCHLDAGSRPYGNSFAAVAANYPKFRNRSGKVESVEFRINDCFERSLNGKMIDTSGREMRAMVAYIKWIGKDVQKKIVPKSSGVPKIEILNRAADPVNGRQVYVSKCLRCHGAGGEGMLSPDSTEYSYPPLWGKNSYNVSAGLYRISSLAGFVKYNMPYTLTQTEPQLSDEDVWDVSAYICAQQRPEKFFTQDWPKIETKPFDHPFGPFADTFSEARHKYGPFNFAKNKKQGK